MLWQVHVYGKARDDLVGWCANRGVPLHVFEWKPEHDAAGLARSALIVLFRGVSNAILCVRHGSHLVLKEQGRSPMEYGIIAWLVIGAIAGWIAGQIVKGGGFGLVVDIIVGIVGAVIGGFLAGALGLSTGNSIIGSIVLAVIGAVVLLVILRIIKRA